MKIVVAVNRKIGQPNYGSEGASCEIALDLPENSARDSAALVAEIRAAYALAEQAVGEQLARHGGPAAAGAVVAVAAPEPASLGWVHGDPDDAAGSSRIKARNAAPSRPKSDRAVAVAVAPAPSSSSDRAPSSGRALWAWVKDRDPSGALGLVRVLDQLGRTRRWGGRVVDWDAAQVEAGVSAVEERLEGLNHDRMART